MNTKKTKEIVFGNIPVNHNAPITIHGEAIEQVGSYTYLGVIVDNLLSWGDQIEAVCKKTKQRIYFLRRLRSFGTSKRILLLFFTSVILSVLQYCSTSWFGCLSDTLRTKVLKPLNICSKIVGQPLETLFDTSYTNGVLRLARGITSNNKHPLHGEYDVLPLQRRYRVPTWNRVQLRKSFVHQSTLLLNKHTR